MLPQLVFGRGEPLGKMVVRRGSACGACLGRWGRFWAGRAGGSDGTTCTGRPGRTRWSGWNRPRPPSRFVSDKAVPAGKPVVMTMHRAKGMEFARVLIFGVDSSALPAPFALKNVAAADKADILQREKSLLYVAATRARDELVLLWAGDPSELLPSTRAEVE